MFDFNDRKIVTEKLKELQAKNIPHMTLEKVIINNPNLIPYVTDIATDEEIKKCNDYLYSYCEDGYNDGKDIFSNETCIFQWGLAHGEMFTNDNGLGRTYYHYLTLGGKKHRVVMLLQYHPSGYSVVE